MTLEEYDKNIHEYNNKMFYNKKFYNSFEIEKFYNSKLYSDSKIENIEKMLDYPILPPADIGSFLDQSGPQVINQETNETRHLPFGDKGFGRVIEV